MWVEDIEIKSVRGKCYFGTYLTSYGYAVVMKEQRVKSYGKSLKGYMNRFKEELVNEAKKKFREDMSPLDIRIEECEKNDLKKRKNEILSRSNIIK